MELLKLPDGMRHLRNLQCLDITNCYKLLRMPVGIKKLASLQRLSNFIIDIQHGARIGELENLNLLGWELEIQGLQNIQEFGDARSANLSCKTNLISLVLDWGNMRHYLTSPVSSEGVKSVLEGLEPNSKLKKLEIRNYPSERISPCWMENLTNLVSIRFNNCERCSHISALGKLPNLKILRIRTMNLARLHDENNSTSGDGILFPSLEILHISSCMNFIALPSSLPKLKELTLIYCPALCSLPDGLQSLRELTYLEISRCEDLVRRCEKEIGEDWPKISHVTHIILS